jgi:hypothetical protein
VKKNIIKKMKKEKEKPNLRIFGLIQDSDEESEVDDESSSQPLTSLVPSTNIANQYLIKMDNSTIPLPSSTIPVSASNFPAQIGMYYICGLGSLGGGGVYFALKYIPISPLSLSYNAPTPLASL